MNWDLWYFKEDWNWERKNIIILKNIKNNEDLFDILNNIKILNEKTNYTYNIMKNNILPLWEDINNKNGTIYWIKINIHEKINK